jgi:hypothetical protein
VLGETVATASGCISSIAKRIINSTSTNMKVKIGGAAILICAAKENHQRLVEDLNISNLCANLVQSLVDMLISAQATSVNQDGVNKEVISICRHTKDINDGKLTNITTIISGADVALWLLSVLACHDEKSKIAIMEAGAIEILTDRIANFSSQYSQVFKWLIHYVFGPSELLPPSQIIREKTHFFVPIYKEKRPTFIFSKNCFYLFS